ncbi:hypothetical protein ABKN59_004442 [Abortiporus biennis]
MSSPPHPLTTTNHYIRFKFEPACSDAFTVRKLLQDALLQTFGMTSANIYMDVLWFAEDGSEVVVRVNANDCVKIIAAAASSSTLPNLKVVKESPFLPSLLSVDSTV